MRKFLKDNILDVFHKMYLIHKNIKNCIEKKDIDSFIMLLQDCQDAAIQLGTILEENEGEGIPVVTILEGYCESIYSFSIRDFNLLDGCDVRKKLDDLLLKAENSVKNDIDIKLEIVFLPYKASMWDSMESIWECAELDSDCDVYVVPIPYYDRKTEYSDGMFHYEGMEYPENVSITDYRAYDLEKRRPDIIYVHNPYDGDNIVTSVDPQYYSTELKKYTKCLVYVPYFATGGMMASNFYILKSYLNYDYIITQSECLHKFFHQDTIIQEKLKPLGSPKFDAVINRTALVKQSIYEKTEGYNAVFMYNTSLSSMLTFNEKMIEKINYVLDLFAEHEEVFLLWRPHPLIEATLTSMRPELVQAYKKILEKASEIKNVMIDDSASISEAVAACDAYIGEETSSVVHLFGVTGKPIFLTNQSALISKEDKDNIRFFGMVKVGDVFWVVAGDRNCLIKTNINGEILETQIIPGERCDVARLYNDIVCVENKIIMAPYCAEEIAIFDVDTKEFTKIAIEEWVPRCFVKAVRFDESVYMIPGKYNAIVKLDVQSGRITYIRNIYSGIPGYFQNDKISAMNGVVVDAGKLYIASAFSNYVTILDLKSHEIKNVEVGAHSYWSMDGANGMFILGSNEGSSLTLWDVNDNTSRELVLPPGFRSVENGFYSILYHENIFYVFPKKGNMILRVDTKTMEAEECFEELTPYFLKRKNAFYNWESNTLFSKSIDGNIVCQFAYQYGMDIIEKSGIKHIPISLITNEPEYNCEKLLCKQGQNLPWAIRESNIFTLKDFISYVILKRHDSEKQIEQYRMVANNLDGTAGVKIHEFIKTR